MKTKFSGILTLLLAFVVQLTFAQDKAVSGTVSDESGMPVAGVNIIVNVYNSICIISYVKNAEYSY